MHSNPAAEAAALAIPYKFAEAYARRDLNAVLALFADDRDVTFVGTGADERRVGLSQVRDQIERNLDQSRALFFRFDWVRAAAAGPVSWFAAEGVMQADLRDAELDFPVRFTGVLEVVHGEWRLVQAHLSLPAAGQHTGESFPTSIDAVVNAVQDERPNLEARRGPDGTVTLLFTDIVDSTTLNEKLGDIRWMEVLRQHNAIVRAQSARHGGYEVKSYGDGFMFAFTSGREAIRCAIDLQRAMERYNREHPGQEVNVRCGLHAGEMVREEDDFFGRNVVLAARITDWAQPGTIWVSALLKALTESSGDIRFGRGESVQLKGLSGTQRAYQVLWDEEPPAVTEDAQPADADEPGVVVAHSDSPIAGLEFLIASP
ncbi:MAG: adenylate/guanylate cyclase domain-containing protein [Dehalococcoidia bacterium]|nr:adenylate/guanylate cyclase domain-containing protein [Dehalococcoidia bacterium]